MKKVLLAAVLGLLPLLSFGQTTIWNSDPAHSRLGFTVEHLTISEIDGNFANFTIKVTTSKGDYSDAQIEVVAQTKSINTGIEARDNHLRTADFFDVEQYPTLTFTSSSLEKTGDNTAKLKGSLTMHGVTKPIELNVVYKGTVTNPMSNIETAGFKITGTINRSDFGIGSTFPNSIVGDTIHITVNAEFSPNK